MLFCHLRQFLNLYSESLGTELYSLALLLFCLLFLAMACRQIQWHAGCLYVAKQEVPARASQHWCFGHISFISGEVPALLSFPSPGRLVLPCPFPRWSRHHRSFPHSRTVLGGDHAKSSWKAAAGGRGSCSEWRCRGWWDGSDAPRSQRRLGAGNPKFLLCCEARNCVLLSLADICWQRHELFRKDPSVSLGATPRSEACKQLLGSWEMGGLQAERCGARSAMLGPLKAIP